MTCCSTFNRAVLAGKQTIVFPVQLKHEVFRKTISMFYGQCFNPCLSYMIKFTQIFVDHYFLSPYHIYTVHDHFISNLIFIRSFSIHIGNIFGGNVFYDIIVSGIFTCVGKGLFMVICSKSSPIVKSTQSGLQERTRRSFCILVNLLISLKRLSACTSVLNSSKYTSRVSCCALSKNRFGICL